MKHAAWIRSILCVSLLSFPLFNLPAQTEVSLTSAPRVSVLAPINESGRTQYDALALTMVNTIEFTLRLLGDYRIQDLAPGSAPILSIGDAAEAARFSEEQDLDYLVLGRLDSTEAGGILFEIVVWDRAEASFTIRQEAVAEGLFDTFDVADELTVEILSAMTGRRIAFGTILLQPDGGVTDNPGAPSFLVFVDGQYTGYNVTRLESIPAGKRRVTIVPFTGNPRGTAQYAETVMLPPNETVTVRYPAQSDEYPWFVPELVTFDESGSSDRPTSPGPTPPPAPVPAWFDAGLNRDRGLWRSAIVREIVGSGWFHDPARWESDAARYPVVDWHIDGSLEEWPRGTAVYRIDPDREPDAYVRVSELGLAHAPDAIHVFLVLDGDWHRFLRNSEPAIYLSTTVTGDGPSRIRYVARRQSGRWRLEGRENRTPYSEYPFQSLRGGQAATEGPVVEMKIPLDRFDHIRQVEILEIGLEYEQGNDFEVAYRIRQLGPPEVR